MKTTFRSGVALIMILYLSGCAVGRKMSYENKEVKPDYSITKSILTVFQDKRPEVLAGSEKPSWCGHMNSTAQIPYNMQTESGRPLADEFANSMAASFNKQAVKSAAMLVNMNTSIDSISAVFSKDEHERLLLFTMNKWESSANPRFSDIHYEVIVNLELKVYDKAGNLLAKSNVQDTVSKNQDMAVNLKRLQAMADEVFITQVRALLNDESVKKSLQ
jgi:hypothetical protein